jgi:DNA-binding SARP family transcriptional activator
MAVSTVDAVEFRILGPLEITAGHGHVEVSGTRQRVVLATLLLNVNRTVSSGRLLEAVYGERLPPTSRSQLQIAVSALRRVFSATCGTPVIETRGVGYIIEAPASQLDYARFTELITRARACRDEDHLEQAAAHYRSALRLWRGPALDGIESRLVQEAASRLDEQRVSVNEDRISVELLLGRHGEMVGELTELIAEYPLRERLHAQLMLALYRCGRTAEALQAYQQARQTIVDELGIEVGEPLQQLEYAILTGDPGLDPQSRSASAWSPRQQAPCLLPADIADFTGRLKQVEEIRNDLMAAQDEARLAVPIVVITGKGGVGKTTIAVHASHGIAGHFPDGQLFADLRGASAHPAGPMEVLERFLRALGVPGTQIPDGLDERAEAYRNLLAGRRILVVLDDAAGESEILPLLPGRATSAVVITSRSRLTGLAGAARLTVDVLDADKSLDLLGRIIGTDRVRGQARAAAQIAELCGHLPLALRIAGARLSARPHWSLAELVSRLTDETRRLDELRHGNLGFRANISLSYESVDGQARRLFRLLALLDVPVFCGWVTAALLDQPVRLAQDLLDDLVAAQLIETTGSGAGPDTQYRFHDLIRVFARERLAAEEKPAARRAALERALGALLYLADEAHSRLYGGDYVRLSSDVRRWILPGSLVEQLTADPLSWYETERVALISGVRQAAQAGLAGLCWNLAVTAVSLYESRVYLDDWRETHETALEATRQSGDTRGQAAILYSLGSLHMLEQRFSAASELLAEAAELFAGIGDDQGIALVVRHLAFLDRLGGRLDEAAGRYERALVVFRAMGDQAAAAHVLHNIAQVELDRGQPVRAQGLLAEALRLSKSAPSGRVEAQVLYRIGEAHLAAGELDLAIGAFEQALRKVRDTADPIGEAYALHGIGVAKARHGDFGEARSLLLRAQALAGAAGERLAEGRALLGLAELSLASGDPAQAVGYGEQASGVFRSIGVPLEEARAQELLSGAHAARGDTHAAARARAAARALRG